MGRIKGAASSERANGVQAGGLPARLGTYFALALVPLAYLPSVDVWSDLFRRGVLGAGSVLAMVALCFGGGLANLSASPLIRPLAVLGLAHVVSTLLNGAGTVAWLETERVAVLGLVALLASAAAGSGASRRAAGALLCGLAAVVLSGVPSLGQPGTSSLSYGTLENRNDLGTLAAASLVLGLALGPRSRIGAGLLAAGGLGLCASRTRGAVLAAGLASGALLFGRRSGAPRRAAAVALGALVLASAAVLLIGRLGAVNALGASAEGRLGLWRAAATMFAERPLFGHGPGSFRIELLRLTADRPGLLALDAHNDLLQALAETGIAGTLALVWVFAAALAAGKGDAAERAWRYALAAALFHSSFHMVLRVTAPAALTFAAAGLCAPAAAIASGRQRSLPARLGVVASGALLLALVSAPAFAAISARRAQQARQVGDWPAAGLWAKRALRFHPAMPEAWDMLAQALLVQQDPKGALDAAAAGLKLSPYEVTLLVRAGEARYVAGDVPGARRYFEAALRYDPGSAKARRLLERTLR